MTWFLVRQDTHGTRFDVSEHSNEAEARAAMASFEEGYPHHQTYYVEQRACEQSRLVVAQAGAEDVDALVELQCALFREDAGEHDPHADITWAEREGRDDITQLMDSPDALVLAAKHDDTVVGMLIGYATQSSPTRQPIEFAVLRSMYVAEQARRSGTATQLAERFLIWARDRGCVEAHVSHYAANSSAQALYAGLGFEAQSVLRTIAL